MPFIAPAAVTLTMKKRHGARSVDDIAASENFKHFRNRLEHSLLGSAAKRYGRHLLMIVVLETSADNRLHYHCIIDRPYHCTFHRFITVVREEWARTDFGYRQVDIQDEPDEGWTSYLLKRRQKRSLLDSIDWANCQLFAE
ncbi:rolling circle replication-associated protein [Bradyrhizobium shewense]